MYAKLDLMWLLRDWKTCLTICASELIVNLGSFLGIVLLAERFNGIGEWSKPHILFFLGYGLLVRGILETFFNNQIALISRRIGRGQLDHILIQPNPLLFALLTEGFIPFTGCWSLLFGIGLSTYAIITLRISIHLAWIGIYLVSIASSSVLILSISFIIGSVAFWSPAESEEISAETTDLLFRLSVFPLDGMFHGVRMLLITILPVGLIAWHPSRYLLGLESKMSSALWTPFLAGILFLLAIGVFTKGMTYYVERGSQRYSRLGHRG
jgi:ABC-2 type transport system permease protein